MVEADFTDDTRPQQRIATAEQWHKDVRQAVRQVVHSHNGAQRRLSSVLCTLCVLCRSHRRFGDSSSEQGFEAIVVHSEGNSGEACRSMQRADACASDADTRYAHVVLVQGSIVSFVMLLSTRDHPYNDPHSPQILSRPVSRSRTHLGPTSRT